MINIISNGSKWAGEPPDSVEKLLEVLAKYALDRRFEQFGGFITKDETDDSVRFFGNFFNLSHVFQIVTDEPEIIERLSAAIHANMERPDYLSQHKPQTPKFRYMHADNGNCRVYYRGTHTGGLYCWQVTESAGNNFELLTCSKDGEPDCPLKRDHYGTSELPRGSEWVEQKLREYLKTNDLAA